MAETIRQHAMTLFLGKLAKASFGLFVGGITAGVLAYIFQILMGRMLDPHDYGVFSAIMALSAVVSAPLGTLLMAVSKQVSTYRAIDDKGSITHFYYSINLKSAIFGILVLALCFLFVDGVQAYLKVSQAMPIYLLGVLLFFTFPQVINHAFLQGLQKFIWLSAGGTLGVLFKIIFAVLLIWLGYGVTGAIWGAILSAFAGWLVTFFALNSTLLQGRHKPYKTTHLTIKPVIPIFIANAAFAAMTQLDIVLVNYFFPSHEAGLYAAASILGKAVMYLPGGIVQALFPMVADNDANQRGSAHLLLQAIGLTALLCGAGAIFYYFTGELLVAKLYGEDYRAAGEILKIYGFAILPMALVMIAEHFLIAKGRVLFAYLFVVFAPLQIIAIYLYHDSLKVVVGVMGASGLLVALVGYGLLWRDARVRV
jgi:O-antigen/teichoic acid export membrane protein